MLCRLVILEDGLEFKLLLWENLEWSSLLQFIEINHNEVHPKLYIVHKSCNSFLPQFLPPSKKLKHEALLVSKKEIRFWHFKLLMSVFFNTPGLPAETSIERFVTIGAYSLLRSCTIEPECIIGQHSILMEGSLVETHSILEAGSVVPPGRRIPTGELWAGNPARFVRTLSHEETLEIPKLAVAINDLSKSYFSEFLPYSTVYLEVEKMKKSLGISIWRIFCFSWSFPLKGNKQLSNASMWVPCFCSIESALFLHLGIVIGEKLVFWAFCVQIILHDV